jgi:hypothetical protein
MLGQEFEMENIKIKIQENGHLRLTIDPSKVVDQTERGSERIAKSQWETIPGFTFADGSEASLLVQLVKKRQKKTKVTEEQLVEKRKENEKNKVQPPKRLTKEERGKLTPEEKTDRKRRKRRRPARDDASRL